MSVENQTVPKSSREAPTKWRAYGRSAAVTFETDQTRGGVHTLLVDVCPANGSQNYDWSKKISIQLTASELPLVAAVFAGILPFAEAKNHGGKTKGLELKAQEGSYFLRAYEDSRGYALPITPSDGLYILGLFIQALMRQHLILRNSTDALNFLSASFRQFKGHYGSAS